jgi:hypothetical protein
MKILTFHDFCYTQYKTAAIVCSKTEKKLRNFHKKYHLFDDGLILIEQDEINEAVAKKECFFTIQDLGEVV